MIRIALLQIMFVLFSTVLGFGLSAAEARVQLPNPTVAGIAVKGQLVIDDPPGTITDIDAQNVDGVELQVLTNNRSQQIINGRTSMGFGLQVRANREGTFAIPPITVSFSDGSTATSAAIQLEVWGKQDWLEGTAVVRAEFIPSNIVPGQDAVLRWQVCAPLKLDLEAGPNEAPRLTEGLITRGEAEMKGNGVARAADGSLWQIMNYSQLVTCSTPGTYRADGQMAIGRMSNSFFDRGGFRRMFTAPIRPATLTVTALPMEGRPDDYTNLVGAVSIEAALERNEMVLGEGTKLTISISGEQVDYATRPELTPPPGLRLRPLDQSSLPGRQTFTWNVEPEQSGDFTIPPISLPWFDPSSGSYRRSHGSNIALKVLPGRQRQATVLGGQVAASPAVTTTVLPSLPAPLQGRALSRPAPWLGWLCAALALALGLGAGFVARARLRPREVNHNAQLNLALKQKDLAKLDQILHQMRSNSTNVQEREQLNTFIQAVEQARFGGSDLSPELRSQLQQWRSA